MDKLLFFCFCLVSIGGYCQKEIDFKAIDSLYREDQFYIGTTFGVLVNKPEGVAQNSVSLGIHAGLLRDFPVNKKRTLAIAPGLGFSYINLKDNLVITQRNSNILYATKLSSDFTNNRLSMYFVDLPIEFRWRTSNYESHKFWRLYTGVKLSYLLSSTAKMTTLYTTELVTNNKDLNKFLYGLYVVGGYNTWNVYGYYGMRKIFNNGVVNDASIDFKQINVGLIFYVL